MKRINITSDPLIKKFTISCLLLVICFKFLAFHIFEVNLLQKERKPVLKRKLEDGEEEEFEKNVIWFLDHLMNWKQKLIGLNHRDFLCFWNLLKNKQWRDSSDLTLTQTLINRFWFLIIIHFLSFLLSFHRISSYAHLVLSLLKSSFWIIDISFHHKTQSTNDKTSIKAYDGEWRKFMECEEKWPFQKGEANLI